MAITTSQIRTLCPSSFPDEVYDDIICMVNARIGQCVTDSYPNECTQDTVLKYAACYFIADMSGPEASSEKAANGASVSYSLPDAGTGLKSNQWGRLLISVDIAGCYSNLVADEFFMFTAGATTNSGCC